MGDSLYSDGSGSKIEDKPTIMNRSEQKAASAIQRQTRFVDKLQRQVNRGGRQGEYAAQMLGHMQQTITGDGGGIATNNINRDVNSAKNIADQKVQGSFGTHAGLNPAAQEQRDELARQAGGLPATGQPTQPTALQGPNGNENAPVPTTDEFGNVTATEKPFGGIIVPISQKGPQADPSQTIQSRQSFAAKDKAAQDRATARGAFGTVDDKGKLVTTDWAQVGANTRVAEKAAADAAKPKASEADTKFETAISNYGKTHPEEAKKMRESMSSFSQEERAAMVKKSSAETKAIKDKIHEDTQQSMFEQSNGESVSLADQFPDKAVTSNGDNAVSDEQAIADSQQQTEQDRTTNRLQSAQNNLVSIQKQNEGKVVATDAIAEAQKAFSDVGFAVDKIDPYKGNYTAINVAFTGERESRFEGSMNRDLINDPSMQLTSEELKKSPDEIKKIVSEKFKQRLDKDNSFNAALGGKVVTGKSGVGRNEVSLKYQKDAFTPMKKKALRQSLKPSVWNDDLESVGQSKADIETDKAKDDIINAALEYDYPIEEDKELMANDDFVARLNTAKFNRAYNQEKLRIQNESAIALRQQSAYLDRLASK